MTTNLAERTNLLRYGPLHHKLFEIDELLSNVELQKRDDWDEVRAHLHEYRWTSEVVTGESGRQASVWVWKESSSD